MFQECLRICVRGSYITFDIKSEITNSEKVEVKVKLVYASQERELQYIGDFYGLAEFKALIDIKLLPLVRVNCEIIFLDSGKRINNEEILYQNRFIDLAERSTDLETSAFHAWQVSQSEECSLPVRITMGVVFAYNALDLKRPSEVLKAKAIILKFLTLSSSLKKSTSIRHNKNNLTLSLHTVLWHIDLFLGDINDFFVHIGNFLEGFLPPKPAVTKFVDGTLAFNLTKMTNILCYIAFKYNKPEILGFYSRLGILFLNQSFIDFYDGKSNVNEFSVLAEAHKGALRNLILADLLEGKVIYKGYTQKLLNIEGDNYISDFLNNLFRLFKGGEELRERFDYLLLSQEELFSEGLMSLTLKMKGIEL